MKDNSILTAPVTTPARRGWMRYFLAALALCSPVYVQADVTVGGSSYSTNASTNNVAVYDAETSATGTVTLKNDFIDAGRDSIDAWWDGLALAGAVQLNLQGDVYQDAVISMTRETGTATTGYNLRIFVTLSERDDAQASDSILHLSGSAAVKGLQAGFTGKNWHYDWLFTSFDENYSQANERWRVRAVTSTASTLTLNDDTAGMVHQFDGAVGFEQTYVQDGQTTISRYISGNNGANDASFSTTSAGSNGVATLSLLKDGAATQYIHTAKLQDLILEGGTLGFNHLTVQGNVNLVGGTKLQLGVTEDKVPTTSWDKIEVGYYDTNDTLSMGAGQHVRVRSNVDAQKKHLTSTVDGSLTLGSGSSLDFYLMHSDAATTKANVLLTLTGTLTLDAGAGVLVDFSNVDYNKDNGTTYYLAKAGSVVNALENQLVSLGGGYFGQLGTENSQYLTLTIRAIERRTWSGNRSVTGDSYVWSAGNTASLWKENDSFENVGQVVLFGNLYKPANGATDMSNVTSTNPNAGLLADPKPTVDNIGIDAQKVVISGEVAPLEVIINSGYTLDGTAVPGDNTNYWFTGGGSIRDLTVTEIGGNALIPDGTKTTLLKQGTGTAIIETVNTYSGGTTIEGGRLVMKNAAALGTGGIVIRNGATLQADFAATDGAMTITNAITIQKALTSFASGADAILRGTSDKKLIVSTLSGAADTTLLLQGSSKLNTYGVFEVLNPSAFSGTVEMIGYLQGTETASGNVQLVMTSGDYRDQYLGWANATIDLSTQSGTNRTVLALNPRETDGIVKIRTLNGTVAEGASSSVVNIAETTPVTLQIQGLANGEYGGALGYGDYQGSGGAVAHATGSNFNVQKLGASTQSVASAWVNRLDVDGGNFIATKDLVVTDLQVAHGTHVIVGEGTEGSYGLNVGKGGILAIAGGSEVFANVGGGTGPTYELAEGGNNLGDSEVILVAPKNFIHFGDGATITAAGDWQFNVTTGTYSEEIDGEEQTVNYDVAIDIADGANVTFNTHHYCADATISASGSHVMHLLGNMSGHNVNLTFNNENISAGASNVSQDANGLYTGETGTQMGYVAIKDIHQFTGESHITVKDMTVLQVNQSNTEANASNSKVQVSLTGDEAGLQFTDNVSQQYVDNVSLNGGAHVMVGGELKSEVAQDLATIDKTGVKLDVTNRNNSEVGTLKHVQFKQDASTVTMGGTADQKADVYNVKVSTAGVQHATIQNANITSSIVQLHNKCTVDLTESVLVDKNSAIIGSGLNPADITTGPQVYDKDDFTTVTGVGNVLLGGHVEATENATVSVDTLVALTTTRTGTIYNAGDVQIMHFETTSFQNINVSGDGLTIFLAEDIFDMAYSMGMEYIAIEIAGTGQFQLETPEGNLKSDNFVMYANNGYEITDAWVGSHYVSSQVGSNVSSNIIWLQVPEPTTATLSLLALAGLCARRRRK